MKIQFVRSKELILTTHAGLATVGALLSHTGLLEEQAAVYRRRPQISHSSKLT
jgi:hypothetical protein